MRVTLRFQDEAIDLNVREGALAGEWHGPDGADASLTRAMLAQALESPSSFPPLRSAIVPGDRVTIALGAGLPDPLGILEPLLDVLAAADVTAETVTVVTEIDQVRDLASLADRGVTVRAHDPGDRTRLAYLASTAEGRRVYLNRDLTDADIVIPIGRIAFDQVFGYSGPWGTIFPGLSDYETIQSFRLRVSESAPARERPCAALTESDEVSWLLGCQFHVGVVAGATGIVGVVAGRKEAVHDEGARLVDVSWSYRAEERSELAVIGIGNPRAATGIEHVARGLLAATHLVRRGGKIVALTHASGPFGPAVRGLMNLDDPARIAATLRKHESDPDHTTARNLARALAWADVYLLSAFDPSDIDDLGLIPLDRASEAERLAMICSSCQVVSNADLVRAEVVGDSESD